MKGLNELGWIGLGWVIPHTTAQMSQYNWVVQPLNRDSEGSKAAYIKEEPQLLIWEVGMVSSFVFSFFNVLTWTQAVCNVAEPDDWAVDISREEHNRYNRYLSIQDFLFFIFNCSHSKLRFGLDEQGSALEDLLGIALVWHDSHSWALGRFPCHCHCQCGDSQFAWGKRYLNQSTQ